MQLLMQGMLLSMKYFRFPMSERVIPVQVNLPKLTYRAVAQIATQRGINAHTWIEELVERELDTHKEPVDKEGVSLESGLISEIASWNRLGLTDVEISKKLHITLRTVTKHRQAMKLPGSRTLTKNERKYRKWLVKRISLLLATLLLTLS